MHKKTAIIALLQGLGVFAATYVILLARGLVYLLQVDTHATTDKQFSLLGLNYMHISTSPSGFTVASSARLVWLAVGITVVGLALWTAMLHLNRRIKVQE